MWLGDLGRIRFTLETLIFLRWGSFFFPRLQLRLECSRGFFVCPAFSVVFLTRSVTLWGLGVMFLRALLQPHSEKGLETRMDTGFLAIKLDVTLLQQGYEGWKI